MNITITVTLLLFAVLGTYLYFAYKKIKNIPEAEKHASIREFTDVSFQEQVKKGVVLVDFWAAWCMPCKMMAPILNETAEEIGSSATIAKLDVESNPNSSRKYEVRNIPTLLLFKDGKVVNRFVGVKTKDFLVKEIRKVV